MSNINISNLVLNNTIKNNKNSNNSEQFLQVKEILTATVKNKSDEYITLKGKNVSFDISTKDVVFNGSDTLEFEVISANESKIELKQLNVSNQDSKVFKENLKQLSSDEILEMFKQNNLFVEEDVLETDTKKLEEQKTKEILRKIQNDILYATNTTSDSAIIELMSNNIDVASISLDVLNKLTTAIDKKPLESYSNEEIDAITKKYIEENNISKEGLENKAEIIKELTENGLNVTKSNISQIENALNKFNNALNKGNFEDLVNFDDVSIQKFAELSYSNTDTVTDYVSENEQLYKDLAKSLNLTYNDELKDVFNKFLNKDIPITKENLEKLSNISENLNNLTTEELISKLVDNLSKGKKASDTLLFTNIDNSIKPDITLIEKTLNTKEVLNDVKQENIASVINSGKVLTIENIKNSVINNETANIDATNNTATTKTYKDLLTLMQKLTFESAQRLAKSGIDIDTQTVTDALNKVKELENQSYNVALIASEVEANAENVETMQTLFDRIGMVSVLNKTYGKIDGNEIINNISEYSNLFKNSSLAYDVFSTKVSNKWNDSITNYIPQIEAILEDLGLESNEENIEACEILIKSKVDITPESILDVKTLNLKLDKITETLHPKVVCDMLNDGVNPLNLNIDEIIDYIDSYENTYVDNLSDKLARNIIDLQKDKSIDEETINAIKSFYKALNIVLKDDKVSIGKAVDSEHSLTIKNLLDTAKYYNETKGSKSMVNEVIGDEVKQFISNENSIENTIQRAVAKSSYEQNLLEKLERESNNESLKDFMLNNENFEDFLISEVTKSLEQFNIKNGTKDIKDNDVSQIVAKIEDALANTPLSVELLLNNEAPINIKNLSAIKEMLENPTLIRQKLKDLINDDENLENTFTEISEESLSTISGVGSVLDIQIGEIENSIASTDNLLLQKTEILSSLNLMSLFNKNEATNYSQMVVKLPLSDEVTTVNMYVIDDNFETKNEKTIAFSLNTDYLGNIEATLNITGNSADINIKGDLNGVNYLKENEEEIKQLFVENGYTDVTLNFIESNIDSIFIK